jgi:hypothetical protein
MDTSNHSFDKFVKTTFCQFFVIPAKAGGKRPAGDSDLVISTFSGSKSEFMPCFEGCLSPAFAGMTEQMIFYDAIKNFQGSRNE